MNEFYGPIKESISTTGERALSWIIRHIEQCYPFCSASGPTEDIETALAEHLLLLFVLSKRKSPSPRTIERAGYKLRQSLLEICHDARQLDYCTQLPAAAFTLPCLTVICFEDQPTISLHLSRKHLIQITSDLSRVYSLVPWKQCEAHYFSCLLQNRLHFPENLIKQLHHAILMSSNVKDLTPALVYEMTHLIFYVTNFGSSSEIGNFDYSILGNTLSDVIKTILQWDHIDLLGEMIAAWNCVAELVGYNDTYALAWETLKNRQMPDGSFRSAINEGCEQQYTTDNYLSRYHEILVTALAYTTITTT